MKRVIVALALMVISASVFSAPIRSLEITGGNFFMAGAGGEIIPGAFSYITLGGYDGDPTTVLDSEFPAYSIATFDFGFFGPVAIYTSESDGLNSGFAPPSGDITDNLLTLDLSAWTAYWNGTSFNQGSSSDMLTGSVCDSTGNNTCSTPIVTTYDANTGFFTATWDAVVIGGPFNAQLGSWQITGIATVPLPAAAWFFLTGFIVLTGLAKRHKNSPLV